MTDQTRQEIIRAKAQGISDAQIMSGLCVTEDDIKSIAESEIQNERSFLREMGAI